MKLLRLSFVCLALSLSLNQARAALAFNPFSGPAFILGIFTGSVGYEGLREKDESCGRCVFQKMMGGIFLIGGIVILDDETQQMSFTQVELSHFKDNEQITTEEIEIFNSEVDQLNAILQDIALLKSENQQLNLQLAWQDYAQYIAPETAKIAKAIALKLTE